MMLVIFGSLQDCPPDVKELIRTLGSEDVAEREQATRKLKELGEAAIPELRKLTEDRDAEVAARARELVRDLSHVPGAVQADLIWLATHQQEDGSWGGGHDDYAAGLTGWAVLAFLAAGVTPASHERTEGLFFGETVRKGLRYLLTKQSPEGCLAPRNGSKYILSHAAATLALCEASRLADGRHKVAAKKAVDFLLAAQNPGKGWRYSLRCGDNDTHITLIAVLALKAAEHAGLAVPASAYDGAKAWLEEVADDEGRTGYTYKGTRRYVPSPRGPREHPESLTAMGVLLGSLLDPRRANPKGAERLSVAPPDWSADHVDFYYWFLGTLALLWHEGPSATRFLAWRSELKKVLLAHVHPEKTWEGLEPHHSEGGTAYAVTMHALALQTPSRHVTVLLRASRP